MTIRARLLLLPLLLAVAQGCASEENRSQPDPVHAAELKRLNAQLASRDGEVRRLKQELETSQERLQALSRQQASSDAQIKELQLRLAAFQRHLAARDREVKDHESRARKAGKTQRRLAVVSKELANLRSQFAAIQLAHQAETARNEKLIEELQGKLKGRE